MTNKCKKCGKEMKLIDKEGMPLGIRCDCTEKEASKE